MESLCVTSLVSGIRTLKLPLLPLWEKGAGGRGAKAHGNPEHQHDQAVAQTGCVVGQRRSTKIAPESRANVACR